ncbi:WD40-repeat-containing domain protein [Endogone sp. FLAS-F59071]|nr:WD40-repeat-containing domain protein [Endogone sp. FLAS-F59071]|eukprot:RUS20186.1 WD40-repeat-containing domain protein [Endogone sp. FLAS-F59071]
MNVLAGASRTSTSLPFAHNKSSEKMPRKDENTPPSPCTQPHPHRMPRNHGKLTIHSDFVQQDPNASPPRLSKVFVFGDNLADPNSPCSSLTPLRKLQQTTPTPKTSERALRDITQTHLQSYEYQTKPVTVRVLSSSDNENDLTNDTTLKTTKLVSRKRPRDLSDISPISEKEAGIEETIHYVPRRPRRPALSPFNAMVARETSSSKINVSTRSFLRDFISTERDVYPIMIEGDYPVLPFGCVYSNDVNDGKFLAVADEEGTISILNTKLDNSIEWGVVTKAYAFRRLWLFLKEKPRDTFHAHDNAIFDIKWKDDDQALLTASGDQTARLWDTERRECTAMFSGHRCSVKSASFNPSNPSACSTFVHGFAT